MIDVADMAAAREERAALQSRLIGEYKSPVIAVCLNLAGPRKRSTLSDCFFHKVIAEVQAVFGLYGIRINERIDSVRDTGLYTVFSVTAAKLDAAAIKRCLIQLENEHDAYRVVDLDVIDSDGTQVSREALDEPGRRCWLCDEPARNCARNRTHTIEAMWQRAHAWIYDYLYADLQTRVRASALTGLLYEVMTAPKPGLVDRLNSGAHRDMNLFTFVDSTLSFSSFIDDVLALGCDLELSEAQLFEKLRCRGLRAERDMLTATGGINTQKGLVFGLSLLIGAFGRLWQNHARACLAAEQTRNEAEGPALKPTVAAWRDQTARVSRYALSDFERDYFAETEGQTLFRRHRVTGARGEAASGYPSVFDTGLPRLKQGLDIFSDREKAGVFALLHILLAVEDTNMIGDSGDDPDCYRGRCEDIAAILAELKQVYETKGGEALSERMIEQVKQLDRDYINADISPGGSADILALTWFVYRLFYEQGHTDYHALN